MHFLIIDILSLQIMHTLHRKCNLVHADLSEYNLLWWKDQVWVIDVSQSVHITHPLALEFLHRDCTNICKVSSLIPCIVSSFCYHHDLYIKNVKIR